MSNQNQAPYARRQINLREQPGRSFINFFTPLEMLSLAQEPGF